MAPDKPHRWPRTATAAKHSIGGVRRVAGKFADPAKGEGPNTQARAGRALPMAEIARVAAVPRRQP
jgi:hypothetical protein